MENIHAIILAGGKGTRMRSEMPKCAYPFLGKPMISYILDSCRKAEIKDIIVVVGYKADEMRAYLPNDVKSVYQSEQLGTAHATKCCEEILKGKEGLTLVFPGDMPLVDNKTINELIEYHKENKLDATVVTTIFDNPGYYGRIKRKNGKVQKIVEFKDCTEEEKLIKEINAGLYCFNNKLLFDTLEKIKNNNAAGEYYLTDIIELLGNDYNVNSFLVENDYKLTGINDVDTLIRTEQEYLKHKN